MKTTMTLAALLGLALFSQPALYADTVADTPAAVVNPAAGKVGVAVSTLPIFNGVSPNTSARYYVYLCSAGWCGPCNAEMPHVVEAYKQMKDSGLVELILLDFDRDTEAAKAFMAKYGANFPAVMGSQVQSLPGYTAPRGIPKAVIVDADGNLLRQGHGSIVTSWKAIISAYEQEKGLRQSFPQQPAR